MYSKDETLDLFEKVQDHIKSAMAQELGYFLNMNAIMIQLLLHEAEKQKANLQCEISQIENMQNMKEMNEFINSLNNLKIINTGKNKSLDKLGSISSIEGLIKENEIMKHDNDMLNQQIKNLNNKNLMLSTEIRNLTEQNKENSQTILELRKEIKNLTQKVAESVQTESKETVETLKKLEKESQDAKKN